MPRLQPRCNARPCGIENILPFDDQTEENGRNFSPAMNTCKGSNAPLSPLLTSSSSLVPSSSESTLSPVPNQHGNHYKHLLLNYSPSTSLSFDTDTSCSSSVSNYSDLSLTPPTNSRPQMLVSAKRYGSEVRRQHSKRRRRRRRPQSSTNFNLQRDCSRPCSNANEIHKCGDSDIYCLWKGEEDPYRSMNTIERKDLSLQTSSDEEEESTDKIINIVRAEHLREAELTNRKDNLPPMISAYRYQPKKRCLKINPRTKRPNDQMIQYKTPPTSPDELDAKPNNQPRRVQFGLPSAVEYEVDRPTGHLTPMSQELTRKRYSMDPKESTYEEEKLTQETKENNIILSEWDEELSIGKFSRREQDRTSDDAKEYRSLSKPNRKDRRSSSIFSPSSRICFQYDKNEIDRKSVEYKSTNDISPSIVVAKSLASMTMSPSNTSFGEEHGTFAETNTTPIQNADEQRTWNFLADLGSINSKGAKEISPPPFQGGIKQSHSDPKPTNINLNYCLVGDKKNAISPGCDDSIGNHIDFSLIESSNNTLRKRLIETPSFDREFEFQTVLRNLAPTGNITGLEKSLMEITPCYYNMFDMALSCTTELVEKTKFTTLSSKSTFGPYNLSKTSIRSTKSAIMAEWKEIEICYIKNMATILELKKSKILEATGSYLSFVNKGNNIKYQNEVSVEKDILRLENDIRQEKRSLELWEASLAPHACILCQATVHLSVFSFEESGVDNILKLNFEHSVYGVQTRVIFDINDSQKEIIIEPNYDSSIGNKCPIFKLHQQYLNLLACGRVPIQLNSAEPRESLLNIGQFLGRLDQSAIELERRKVAKKEIFLSEKLKDEIERFIVGQSSNRSGTI